jgi:hypothetical protein
MDRKKRIIHEIASKMSILDKLILHLKDLEEIAHKKYDEIAENSINENESKLQQNIQAATADFEEKISILKDEISHLKTNLAETPWDDTAWENYSPVISHDIPRYVNIGNMGIEGRFEKVDFPLLLPCFNDKHIIIKAEGQDKDLTREVLKSLVARFITAFPVGKLRVSCIDPVGLGSTFGGFTRDLPQEVIDGQMAWYQESEIEKCLTDLENYMAFIQQKYLGFDYQNIDLFNQNAGQIKEPYRLLVVSDFPARFSEKALQHLISIATNGPKTGVYIICMIDKKAKFPRDFNIDDIERHSTLINIKDGIVNWEGFTSLQDGTAKIQTPTGKLLTTLIGKVAAGFSEQQVSIPAVKPSYTELWQGDSRSEIEIPIGRHGAQKTQYLKFNNKGNTNALVVGMPGYGKSTLLHTIINEICLKYSYNEVALYLLDFKQVEFMDYAYTLPHARVVAVKSERDLALNVLIEVENELLRRKDLFGNARNLEEYRNKTGKICQRIVLIIDEFHELFTSDDLIASEANRILSLLVKEGRGFGINIILATQILSGHDMMRQAIIDIISTRIVLKTSVDESRLALSQENDRAKMLERPGEAIYNDKNGRIEGNHKFQIFWTSRDQQTKNILHITEKAQKNKYVNTMYVFNGEEKFPKIENCHGLLQIIDGNRESKINVNYTEAIIGKPFEIKPETRFAFQRQSNSNLLIVGQRKFAKKVAQILIPVMMSLAAGTENEIEFLVLNLLPQGVDDSYLKVNSVIENLPIKVVNFDETEFEKNINELVKIISKPAGRKATNKTSTQITKYLFLLGLHDVNAFKKKLDFEESPLAVKLKNIIQTGPEAGIHTIFWVDTLRTFEKILSMHELMDFDARVLFPMTSDDSYALGGKNFPGGSDNVYLFRQESNELERFAAFGLPSFEWIEAQCRRMKVRHG